MTGVAERHDREVVAALSLALLARAVLGFADSVAITRGSMLDLPVADAVTVAPLSPLWPALLAALALIAAAAIALRALVGWVVAVAACVGYLVTGIADIGALRPGAPLGDPGFWVFFVAYLVVPGIVLGVLVAVRSWFMPVRPGLVPRGLPGRSRVAVRLPRSRGGSSR